jgi:hypothetical protein
MISPIDTGGVKSGREKGVNPTNKLYSTLTSHGGKRTAIKTHGHAWMSSIFFFLTLHIQELQKI